MDPADRLLAAVQAVDVCRHGFDCRECARAARRGSLTERQDREGDQLDAVARLGEWIMRHRPELVGQGHACDLAVALLEELTPARSTLAEVRSRLAAAG